jgi:hypothetical protein
MAEEVTSNTRYHLEIHVPPGMYDVQAIREKEGM